MPAKVDKLIVPKDKDKRKKLDESKHKEIRYMYGSGVYSYQKIANMYGVSKSLIILIVNPDIKERKRKEYAERRKDGRYYSKEKHREHMRAHREHKKDIHEKRTN